MSYASEVRAEPCRLTTIYISNFNNFAHNKPNQQANSDIRVVFPEFGTSDIYTVL